MRARREIKKTVYIPYTQEDKEWIENYEEMILNTKEVERLEAEILPLKLAKKEAESIANKALGVILRGKPTTQILFEEIDYERRKVYLLNEDLSVVLSVRDMTNEDEQCDLFQEVVDGEN